MIRPRATEPTAGCGASAYDHERTCSEASYIRQGTYLHDSLTNRRDPSGSRTPQNLPQAQAHHLLDDHDLVYTTTHSPPRTASLAELPTTPVLPSSPPRRAESTPEPVLQLSKRFEFARRGQRAGDIGWACNIPNPQETNQYGRIDGHALVSSDLHRKHQFMRLSGDPSFDKRAGKAIMMHGSLRKPVSLDLRK